jgi:hypothetical protein
MTLAIAGLWKPGVAPATIIRSIPASRISFSIYFAQLKRAAREYKEKKEMVLATS